METQTLNIYHNGVKIWNEWADEDGDGHIYGYQYRGRLWRAYRPDIARLILLKTTIRAVY